MDIIAALKKVWTVNSDRITDSFVLHSLPWPVYWGQRPPPQRDTSWLWSWQLWHSPL